MLTCGSTWFHIYMHSMFYDFLCIIVYLVMTWYIYNDAVVGTCCILRDQELKVSTPKMVWYDLYRLILWFLNSSLLMYDDLSFSNYYFEISTTTRLRFENQMLRPKGRWWMVSGSQLRSSVCIGSLHPNPKKHMKWFCQQSWWTCNIYLYTLLYLYFHLPTLITKFQTFLSIYHLSNMYATPPKLP